MGRAVLGTILGGILGLFGGIYFVSAVGIQPGDRTDLLVIVLVTVAFGAIGFVIGRRMG